MSDTFWRTERSGRTTTATVTSRTEAHDPRIVGEQFDWTAGPHESQRVITAPPCGCGVPKQAAYLYKVNILRIDDHKIRSTVHIWTCVRHRIDPRNYAQVRAAFEFDHSEDWAIASAECFPAPASGRADAVAAFGGPVTEAAAAPVEVDIRLRSESEAEDHLLRHYRGHCHDSSQCPACEDQQKRDAAFTAERQARRDAEATVRSIISGD